MFVVWGHFLLLTDEEENLLPSPPSHISVQISAASRAKLEGLDVKL